MKIMFFLLLHRTFRVITIITKIFFFLIFALTGVGWAIHVPETTLTTKTQEYLMLENTAFSINKENLKNNFALKVKSLEDNYFDIANTKNQTGKTNDFANNILIAQESSLKSETDSARNNIEILDPEGNRLEVPDNTGDRNEILTSNGDDISENGGTSQSLERERLTVYAVTAADRQASHYIENTNDHSNLTGPLVSLVDDAEEVSGPIPINGDDEPGGNIGDDIISERHDHHSTRSIKFDFIITNNGNAPDTFNIRSIYNAYPSNKFPKWTTYKFLASDGETPLIDTDNDLLGTPDTGIINPGNAARFFILAELPTQNLNTPINVSRARNDPAWMESFEVVSSNDYTVSDRVTIAMFGAFIDEPIYSVTAADRQASHYIGNPNDHSNLTGSLASLVDDAYGVSGSVPENGDNEPAGNTGDDIISEHHNHLLERSIKFDFVITNHGNVADNFNIAFNTGTFPNGSEFIFLADDGKTLLTDTDQDQRANTPIILPGQAIKVFIEVKPPLDASRDASNTAWASQFNVISSNDANVYDTVTIKMFGAFSIPVYQLTVADRQARFYFKNDHIPIHFIGRNDNLTGRINSLVDDAEGVSGSVPENGDNEPAGNTGDDIVSERHDHLLTKSIKFDFIVTNHSYGTDIFNLVYFSNTQNFPSGTKFKFLAGDGKTLLTNTDNDLSNRPDTGPIPPRQAMRFFIKAILPSGAVRKAENPPWNVTVRASSSGDPSMNDTVTIKMFGTVTTPAYAVTISDRQALYDRNQDNYNNLTGPLASLVDDVPGVSGPVPGNGDIYHGGIAGDDIISERHDHLLARSIKFDFIVTNHGNVADDFNIYTSTKIFPNRTDFIFLDSDGTTQLTDTDNDQSNHVNTGLISPGQARRFFVNAKIPLGNSKTKNDSSWFGEIIVTSSNNENVMDSTIIEMLGAFTTPEYKVTVADRQASHYIQDPNDHSNLTSPFASLVDDTEDISGPIPENGDNEPAGNIGDDVIREYNDYLFIDPNKKVLKFDFIVTNNGNVPDTFNIQHYYSNDNFPKLDTKYSILSSDGKTPLTDTDNDLLRLPNTRLIEPGRAVRVFLEIALDPGSIKSREENFWRTHINAISSNDPSKIDRTTIEMHGAIEIPTHYGTIADREATRYIANYLDDNGMDNLNGEMASLVDDAQGVSGLIPEGGDNEADGNTGDRIVSERNDYFGKSITLKFDFIVTNNGNVKNTYDLFKLISPDDYGPDSAVSVFPHGTTFKFLDIDGKTELEKSEFIDEYNTPLINPGEAVRLFLEVSLPEGVSRTRTDRPWYTRIFMKDISRQINFLDIKMFGAVTPPVHAVTISDREAIKYAADKDPANLTGSLASLVDDDDNISGFIPTTGDTTAAISPGDDIVTERNDHHRGERIPFDVIVTNNGNVSDTFNISEGSEKTFPAGTKFFLQDANRKSLTDTNNDKIKDTGSIDPGKAIRIFIVAELPENISYQKPWKQSIIATSVADPTKKNTVTLNMAGNIIDLIGPLSQKSDLSISPHNYTVVLSKNSVFEYPYTINNLGETAVSAASITINKLTPNNTIVAKIFYDSNSNGKVDENEQEVTNINDILDNLNTPVLETEIKPNEKRNLILQVTSVNAINGINLTVSIDNKLTTSGGEALDDVTENNKAGIVIKIASDNWTVIQEQGLDSHCNGKNIIFSYEKLKAKPGQCIRYKLTVTSLSSLLSEASILAHTPPFTKYETCEGFCNILAKNGKGEDISSNIIKPDDKKTGSISATIASLEKNRSATLEFTVKID